MLGKPSLFQIGTMPAEKCSDVVVHHVLSNMRTPKRVKFAREFDRVILSMPDAVDVTKGGP